MHRFDGDGAARLGNYRGSGMGAAHGSEYNGISRRVKCDLANQTAGRIVPTMLPFEEVDTSLRCYPQIYFACHKPHVRDPQTNQVLSARQAAVLDHRNDA